MKLEQKNLADPIDPNVILNELERTMVASIALMKRLRREKRRSHRSTSTSGEQAAADH